MRNSLLYNYPKEYALFSGVISSIGVLLNSYLGGWDAMLQALIVLMGIDFITGFLASVKNKQTNSNRMFWGGVNKILVILFVGVGVVVDMLLGLGEPYMRTAIIWFYIAREGLSLIENYGKMGLPLPAKVAEVLEQLAKEVGA